ncbi:MAG TPA: CHAT domain-containing protein [Candidatus Angelobacter sp.]|jgi:CHAT domain-containing protein
MNAPPNQNCPEVDVLQELAAGIGSPELAQQTMQHVARCATCSAALRSYISEFSEEQSPENAALFNQLQSSKPQWQKQLVHDQIGGGKRFPWLKLVPAMAALAVAIFAVIQGPALLADFKVNQAQKQVAAAFAGRRTTEMRLPSVSHSDYRPFPIELGGENGRSLDEVPTSLHDASGAANQNLLAAKADPRWLQVQGLALLWESTPSSLEKAEKDFERARSAGLATPSLEIDLAASYFERDSRTEHPNLQRTLNLLNEVLSKPALTNDDRASALFNLALAYEKTQAWDLAVSTWEKYLQADSSSSWTTEAQQHLKDAKAKMHPTSSTISSDPDFFLQTASNAGQTRAEEYQDIAITQWLPGALKDGNASGLNATRALGEQLAKRPQMDTWMSDLVSSLGRQDATAVEALADAVKKNGSGDPSGAITQAQLAAKLFSQHKNLAGELRARLEEIHALRRKLDGPACIARADPVLTQLSNTAYHWMTALVATDKAECENLVGKFDEADAGLQTSTKLADMFGFPLLELRNLGISAGNKHLRGNCDESWKESVDGLKIYWQQAGAQQGSLYQFYSVMLQCALETGHLSAGEALLRQAIFLRETSKTIKKNETIECTLHLHLANVLAARKAEQEAKQEIAKAKSLLNPQKLPPQYEMVVKIEPAEFQLEYGNPDLVIAALKPLEATLKEKPDKFFSLRFNQALGSAYFKAGQLENSRNAYEAAIKTAESSLNEIKDWGQRLQWLRATDESYRGLVRVLIDQKKNNEALERWELYKSRPMFQGHSNDTADADGMEANERVDSLWATQDPLQTRVVYAIFGDGINIWVVHRQDVTSHWVELNKQDLENVTREFMEKCSRHDSDLGLLNQLGSTLFSALLQPIISEIPSGQTVVFEPDRMTYNLPMEALKTSDNRYFGEKYLIVYSAGIWVEKALRPPERISGAETVALLDASHASGAGYLPGLEMQADAVVKLFPRTVTIESDKTSMTVMRTRLASSRIFIFMGHGKPDGSGTSLDYDGKQQLRAKDFGPELLKHTQLVVLAACAGAIGRQNGLEDADNLVRAFLSDGVPSIIASHWNVDSSSTSQLMISFYRHLANHEAVAQAMYNARIEILRTQAHPYFWAGFTLAGRAS